MTVCIFQKKRPCICESAICVRMINLRISSLIITRIEYLKNSQACLRKVRPAFSVLSFVFFCSLPNCVCKSFILKIKTFVYFTVIYFSVQFLPSVPNMGRSRKWTRRLEISLEIFMKSYSGSFFKFFKLK